MKKLLIGLMVLVALLSVPMATMAVSTAPITAQLDTMCGLKVTGGVTDWNLVYTMDDTPALLDPATGDPTDNFQDETITVVAYSTAGYAVTATAEKDTLTEVDGDGEYVADSPVTLENSIYMRTNTTGTGIAPPTDGYNGGAWAYVDTTGSTWGESEATVVSSFTYYIDLDQQLNYGELPTTYGFKNVITFAIANT